MLGAITSEVISEETQLPSALATDLDGCFERLVLAYQDRLYGFALRLTGSSQDAEEIVQDAFVRAYHALERYPADQIRSLALRPWLYQITLNVLRNRVRGRQLAVVPMDDVIQLQSPDGSFEQPEALAERAERVRELRTLIAGLPERFRVAVVLRHVEGWSYDELAELLHQPVGTIKANVHRGLKLLKHTLEQSVPREDL